MMNWNSVGVKVILTTTAVLAGLSIISLYFYARTEKQQIIDNEMYSAKNQLILSEAVREKIIDNWEIGLFSTQFILNLAKTNSGQKLKDKILATVPIVNSWDTLKTKAKEGNYRFKAPRIGARNPSNEADSIEKEALNYFRNTPGATEYSHLDEEKKELRYFRPVKLDKQCEVCHGDPATSQQLWQRNDGRDIFGYVMENKRAGDLHGAFEIIKPLGPALSILYDKIIIAIVLTFLIMLVLAIAGYFAIDYFIITPLTGLALKLQDISSGSGNLKARLTVSGKTEFSWLSASFNGFVKKIAKTIDEIRISSDKLGQESSTLATTAQKTEQSIAEQLSETTVVATAMEEMTATAKEIAKNAVNASVAINETDEEAATSKEIVTQVVTSINNLASEVESAANVIYQLDSDSESIGEVLSVIQGIAEQTNLLALNAAIEAARAGEQGRGFAVVADEVRTLASRTQNSTQEIRSTIERLQSRAREAVKVMENGKLQASASVEQAASSGKALANINSKIAIVLDMNNQIASAAEEQTMVVEEINRNIHNISAISEQTSSSAQETSTSCNDLLALAEQLKQAVGHFKT